MIAVLAQPELPHDFTSAALCLQDTIPRGGKFISAYKRNGQRVVVNKIGDIVVSRCCQQPLAPQSTHASL